MIEADPIEPDDESLYPIVYKESSTHLWGDRRSSGADGPPCPWCKHPLRLNGSWDGTSPAHIKNEKDGPAFYSCGPPWSGHACWCTYPQTGKELLAEFDKHPTPAYSNGGKGLPMCEVCGETEFAEDHGNHISYHDGKVVTIMLWYDPDPALYWTKEGNPIPADRPTAHHFKMKMNPPRASEPGYEAP